MNRLEVLASPWECPCRSPLHSSGRTLGRYPLHPLEVSRFWAKPVSLFTVKAPTKVAPLHLVTKGPEWMIPQGSRPPPNLPTAASTVGGHERVISSCEWSRKFKTRSQTCQQQRLDQEHHDPQKAALVTPALDVRTNCQPALPELRQVETLCQDNASSAPAGESCVRQMWTS